MNENERVYFVLRPRTVRDLWGPHSLEEERPYEIAASVTLSALDFENFSEDMLADRAFLHTYARLCGEAPVFRCLLVRRRGGGGGILVVPQKRSFVKWAAILQDETE